MKTLHDWYLYLERQMHVSLSDLPGAISRETRAVANSGVIPLSLPPDSPSAEASSRFGTSTERSPLPVDLGSSLRRGGRRRITETREEIIRRLLDPELALYEAAAVLDLSKATVRRYTDQGRLPCLRTEGGQRRFRLSALLAFLDRQDAEDAGE